MLQGSRGGPRRGGGGRIASAAKAGEQKERWWQGPYEVRVFLAAHLCSCVVAAASVADSDSPTPNRPPRRSIRPPPPVVKAVGGSVVGSRGSDAGVGGCGGW